MFKRCAALSRGTGIIWVPRSATLIRRAQPLGAARDLSEAVTFDGREAVYPFGELDTLVPAFATTIHKSQGSEYPAVVIPIVTQHFNMLARNLLYTGVTRGKQLVVLIGQRKAIGMAVRGGQQKRRWTKLREWLASDRPREPSQRSCQTMRLR